MKWVGEALMAEYFTQIGQSLRTHEDVCHDLIRTHEDVCHDLTAAEEGGATRGRTL